MGLKSFYVCDKCGKEWRTTDKTEQPVAIYLNIKFGAVSCANMGVGESALWCRSCIMKTGLKLPIIEKDKKVAPATQLSFGDKITMLLKDLGFVRN